MPVSLIFTPKHFLRLPSLVLFIGGLGENARGTQIRGGVGSHGWKTNFVGVRAKLV